MTLLGLIGMMVFGGVQFGTRAWEKGSVRAQQGTEVQTVRSLLRRQIEQAYPMVWDEDGSNFDVAFDGQGDSLRFITPALAHLAVGGLYLVGISTEGSSPRRSLVLKWRLLDPTIDSFDFSRDSKKIVLLDDLAKFKFEYFGSVGEGASSNWSQNWHNKDTLPSLVRLNLEFANDNSPRWPALVVAPRIDRSMLCIVQPTSPNCV